MTDGMRLEAVLKRDRVIVLSGLAGVSALAWLYLVYLRRGMPDAATSMESAMPPMRDWGGPDLILTFAMWAVMMIAMMVPSAAPAILLFATISRQRRERPVALGPTTVFLLGYLALWMGFSVAATLAQWGLHAASLTTGMVSAGPILGAVLLIIAGIFQWTPLKHACLTHCRSPLGFFMTEWREGTVGALRMGFKHGVYCIGCCWLLMSLLLAAGAMNLLWVAAMAAFVLVEKAAPAGQWVSRIAGLVLVGWGIWMALS